MRWKMPAAKKQQQQIDPVNVAMIVQERGYVDALFRLPRPNTPDVQGLEPVGPQQARFCINCVHHTHIAGQHFCEAEIDIVTGNPLKSYCVDARHTQGQCGPEGRLFKKGE
jgi:hypothetical protein